VHSFSHAGVEVLRAGSANGVACQCSSSYLRSAIGGDGNRDECALRRYTIDRAGGSHAVIEILIGSAVPIVRNIHISCSPVWSVGGVGGRCVDRVNGASSLSGKDAGDLPATKKR